MALVREVWRSLDGTENITITDSDDPEKEREANIYAEYRAIGKSKIRQFVVSVGTVVDGRTVHNGTLYASTKAQAIRAGEKYVREG